jgi:general secretion pathway protein I
MKLKGMKRRGLSLFEVVISLAIFMTAMAAIGQLITNGVRGAVYARLETQAVIRCESKLAEMLAGVTPLRATSGSTFPDDASWSWSVAIAPAQHESLYAVEVTVAHASGSSIGKVSYSLRRLVRDPQLEMQAYAKQLEQQANQASSSSSTSSTSSSSGASK